MEKNFTERGFGYIEFKDSSNVICSVQESSAAEPKIWLGAKSIGLKNLLLK